MLDVLLDLLAPPRCAGCDMPGELLCPDCRSRMPTIETDWACEKCGAPFGWIVCTECWCTDFTFESAACIGLLERPLSRCITVFKDSGERRLASVLGEMLAERISAWRGWPDAVVPIPATDRALRQRGFDHGKLLAEGVAASLDVSVLEALTHGYHADQRGLSREERAENTMGSFSCVPGTVVPDKILIVDDVLTTAVTLHAASKILMDAGAREIRVGSIARTW